jgi:hypothetical protein
MECSYSSSSTEQRPNWALARVHRDIGLGIESKLSPVTFSIGSAPNLIRLQYSPTVEASIDISKNFSSGRSFLGPSIRTHDPTKFAS